MDPSSTFDIISSEISADRRDSDEPAAARNITRMDVALYKAAVRGEIEAFDGYQGFQLQSLRAANDNTVLHVYLATGKYGVPLSAMVVWLLWPFSLLRRGHFLSVVRIRNWELPTGFVEQILNKCPSLLLQPNAKGQTPLHIAARYDHSAIVRFVIDYRSKSSHGDRENQRNEFEAVREMLRKTDEESNTALHVAVEYGHLKVVQELLHEAPDFPYPANRNQETPLYVAARRLKEQARRKKHDLSLLAMLLDKFKSEVHGGPYGRTVLHAAALSRDKRATRMILENKKNLTKETDDNGQTPLHYAAHLGDHSVVKELLKRDKSAAHVADKKLDMTPLLMAARQGHLLIVKEIISSCPDSCEMVDKRGWNFLHFLACRIDNNPLPNFGEFLEIWRITTNEFIPDLRDQKDSLGLTPLQIYKVVHARPIEENKMKQVAMLLQEVQEEEVGDKPVRTIERYQRWKNINIQKAKDTQLVVATLIATVAFAAAITIPGGYKSEDSGPDQQGTPFLIRNAAFKAFVISNALAFMFSFAAVAFYFQMTLSTAKRQLKIQFAHAFFCTLYAMYALVVAFSTGTYAILQGPSPGLAITLGCIGFGVGFLVWTRSGYIV